MTTTSTSQNIINSLEYHVEQGIALRKNKQYVESEVHVNQALSIDPNNVEALYSLAIIQSNFYHDDKKALDILLKIKKINPNHTYTYIFLAEMYVDKAELSGDQNEYKKAIRYINKAIRLDPTFDALYDILGNIYNAIGHYTLAIRNVKKAIKLSKTTNDLYYQNLAVSYIALNEHHKAINHLLKIIPTLDNPRVEFFIMLCESYLALGDYTKATIYAKKAIETENSVLNQMNLAQCFLQSKQNHKTIEVYTDLLNSSELMIQDSDKAEVLAKLGFCFLKSGDKQQAETYFLQTLEVNQNHEYIPYSIVKYIYRMITSCIEHCDENYSRLISLFTDLINFLRKDDTQELTSAYNTLGYFYYLNQQFDLAFNAFTHVLTKINPECAESYNFLGTMYFQEKSLVDLEKATFFYKACLLSDENYWPAHVNLFLVYQQTQEVTLAEFHKNKAQELNPKYFQDKNNVVSIVINPVC